MNHSIQITAKAFVKASPVYPLVSRLRAAKQIRDWHRAGCPIPPPSVYKQRLVAEYARRFGIKTLIETGTLFGEMVAASEKCFQAIYSIELDDALFEKAAERFRSISHIRVIKGDSGDVLPVLLDQIDGPCLFWLDGHYSGAGTGRGEEDTPVSKELEAILSHNCGKHVVLIDDARLFTGLDGYPTLAGVRKMLISRQAEWVMKTEHDIIRLVPPSMVQ